MSVKIEKTKNFKIIETDSLYYLSREKIFLDKKIILTLANPDEFFSFLRKNTKTVCSGLVIYELKESTFVSRRGIIGTLHASDKPALFAFDRVNYIYGVSSGSRKLEKSAKDLISAMKSNGCRKQDLLFYISSCSSEECQKRLFEILSDNFKINRECIHCNALPSPKTKSHFTLVQYSPSRCKKIGSIK